jgi:hypothetical protein
MNSISGNWAGRIYGTNTGNLFLELDQKGEKITGHGRFLDDKFGLVIYGLSGEITSQIILTGRPENHPDGVVVGKVNVIAALRQDGAIAGKWESEIGTGGTFEVYPHGKVGENKVARGRDIPEQIFTRTVDIGSVRIFQKDLKDLIEIVAKDFLQGQPVVTFKLRGSEVIKFSEAFLQEVTNLPKLRFMKINIQEPEPNGINRTVAVQLSEGIGSFVTVSGSNESWVVGKAESISHALTAYQNNVITYYRKHGLEINGIIFFLMLVMIPEITDWHSRLIFVLVVMALLFVLVRVHRKLLPNTVIFPMEEPTSFRRSWPSVVSWLIAATSSIFAMFVFRWLAGE